ncbi:putative lignostilbene dioxygenase protein [Eutypa lata UCREL1]|uniref:Putative lignostilbene dioxygenase protein n=1 Tax=Eutypa lata (strain UCR-EL1) TaxID=1287681 RepID=M7TS54_EUTLA|nr:putative lignostilbene dioxygenase protein [Eutypa lata UCREL1]
MVRAHSIFQDFAGASRPFRADAEIEDVEVEGEIPKELNGTFYRVSQDPYYERDYYCNGSKTIPFDGDGSISAFRVKDQKVSFQQKYVMTERFVAEKKARRSLFGMFKSPFSHHPCVRAVMDTTANTNVVLHAGKLLALCEHGPAYELDPNTLRTRGHDIFPGEVDPTKPFTAHPHVDPKTGELIAFGYDMQGLGTPQISLYVINKDGNVTSRRDFEFPGGGIIHDCAIVRTSIRPTTFKKPSNPRQTDNYVILMRMPFLTDIKDIEKPGNHQWYYDEKCPAWFGVVPRKGTDPVRWFKYKNCMSIHSGASWEEDGKMQHATLIWIASNQAKAKALSYTKGLTPSLASTTKLVRQSTSSLDQIAWSKNLASVLGTQMQKRETDS